ncbi:hypothetical protein ACVV62_08705 [Streptococcus pluranimalium]
MQRFVATLAPKVLVTVTLMWSNLLEKAKLSVTTFPSFAKNLLAIDGIKLEADTRLYSFTWRKAFEQYDTVLSEKISTLYTQLIQEWGNVALSKKKRINMILSLLYLKCRR